MKSSFIFGMTIVAALGSGLIAGVFFAFSSFVMRALCRLPTREAIAAMKSINAAVLNVWFLGAFLGTAAVCGVGLIVSFLRWQETGSGYLSAGCLLYLIGCLGVTAVCNVPRNEALARVTPDDPDSKEAWARYVAGWTAWNHVRTAASLAACASFTAALGR
jgi:uncharacterized membrane protein